jgi:tetratricopeptide (TPR) repeat protein
MSSRQNWLFALALIVIVFLVYEPAWKGKPIWDDETHITRPELRSFSGLARIWTDPSAAPQYYPVLHTLFWVEYKLWDGSVLPYHLVTILCHAVLAVLLALILRRLDLPGAWLAAFIFALHPVQVESVAWFSEIKNTLSGVFAAAAMLSYLKYDRDRHYGAYFVALAFFILGLLSKTAIVGVPVLFAIISWWKGGSLKLKRDLLPLVPFLAMAFVAGIITIWVEQKFCTDNGETFYFSFLDRVLIAGRLFWFYLGGLFWPRNLTLIYPLWHIDPAVWWQYLFPVAGVILFAVLWSVHKKWRGPFAAALSFLVLLFPVLGFFNLSFFMSTPASDHQAAIFRADHFQYLATIAVIVPVAAGLMKIALVARKRFQFAIPVVGVGLLFVLGTLTYAHSETFRDSETCFRAVLANNPNSVTARTNLGNLLRNRGELDEAIAQYRRSTEIDPDYKFGRYNLGAALLEKGDVPEAISQLRAVLKLDPNHAKAYYSLANALAKQGDRSQAIAYYGRALALTPDFPEAHTNLANVMLEAGNTAGALGHYREALRLQPSNPQTHYNLAVGLVRDGESEAAIPELRTTLQLDPKYPDAEPLLRDLLARKQLP